VEPRVSLVTLGVSDLERAIAFYRGGLERVMDSIRNGLGMGKTEIAKEPSRPFSPHFYAVFAQVHNTL